MNTDGGVSISMFCPICLEYDSIKNDDLTSRSSSWITLSSCGHSFHKKCLTNWIKFSKERISSIDAMYPPQSRIRSDQYLFCPSCRSAVTQSDMDSIGITNLHKRERERERSTSIVLDVHTSVLNSNSDVVGVSGVTRARNVDQTRPVYEREASRNDGTILYFAISLPLCICVFIIVVYFTTRNMDMD